MDLYDEIIEWSRTLPIWQRGALHRLATGSTFSIADIAALAAACITEANQPEEVTTFVRRTPVAPRGGGSVVALAAISDTKSINAIPDGQRLSFEPAGLTVIYGDNGAGKSGYVRVLRQACHTRGEIEDVLPNVYVGAPGTPSASIDYLVDGQPRSFTWTRGSTSCPGEFRAVEIFDCYAATAFVECENEVLWTPSGLDLLERLVTVIDDVRGVLQREARAASTGGQLPAVPAGTLAAAFMDRISATTTAAELDALALNPDELAELMRLDTAFAAAEPTAEAARLDQRAGRLRALRGRLALLEAGLGQAALNEIAAIRASYSETLAAERMLAAETFGDSTLPGVGAGPWRALWDAAENYARAGATPDGVFPSRALGAICVLCQQPLEQAAKDRLDRFHEFVRADVSQTRARAADVLRLKIAGIRNLRVRELADDALVAEVKEINADAGWNLPLVLDAAAAAAVTIAALDAEATQGQLPQPFPPGWPAWLDAVVLETEKQAAAMRSAATTDLRAAFRNRRTELAARNALASGRQQVEAEVQRLTRVAKLERAVASCATAGITRKVGDLTRAHVTDRLMKAFEAEARELRLPMTVQYQHSRNEKGASYQRVILTVAPWANKSGEAVRILSEGERRAVALAACLAELMTRENRSAVVFDDPVCSLDHGRRRLLAGRLARLASDRQVAIFTHDLVFLHMLKEAAAEENVPVTWREVRSSRIACGLCRDKLPTKAMSIKALIGELKERQQQCAAVHRAGRTDEYEAILTNTYGLLRVAWERAVEELLLNQVVMRFDYRVQTQRLKEVRDITDADLAEVSAGMTVSSRWLPGHALAPAMNEPQPEPTDLLNEIGRLEKFTATMRARGRS